MQIQLPDGSIGEFPDDMKQADIEAVLQKQYGQPQATVSQPEDMARGFASGVARAIPQGLDLGGATAAALYNKATGGEGDYFKGFMQPTMTPLDDLTTSIVGSEYKPEGIAGKLSKFAGGFVGPNEVAQTLKGGGQVLGLLKGAAKGVPDFITNPETLDSIYKGWQSGLEGIKTAPEALRQGLVQPFLEATKFERPFLNKEGAETVDAVSRIPAVGDNARYVEGLRKTLSGDGSPIAEQARSAIDDFMTNSAIPADGRDAYRRYMLSSDVTNAMRNSGNEGIRATRTKLNNINPSGMNDAELAARANAGSMGVGEGLLRGVGRGTGVLGSGAAAVAGGSPGLGATLFAVGRGAESLADRIARQKIQDLQNVIMNGRSAPNLGERLGGLLYSGAKKGMGLLK